MAFNRYPVLVWRDHTDSYTAALVEDLSLGPIELGTLAAVAPTSGAALDQLQEYLAWKAKQDGYLPESEVLERKLVKVVVRLRPEHAEGHRNYPAEKSIRLEVECVICNLGGDMRMASLPRFDEWLYFFEGDRLKDLVTHQLQSRFRGRSPRQLSRYLPPRSVFIDEVSVKVPGERVRHPPPHKDDPVLRGIADPLDDRGMRKSIGAAWERDDEVADLVERLTKEKANVVILGEAGAGKTTVIVEAVNRIARSRAKRGPHRYWLSSASRLVAGMKYLGQWEQRCQELIGALDAIDGTLCVENLLELLRVGGTGPGDSVAAFLAPYLQAGELRMVGEATPAELDASRRLLPGFVELFQVLKLPQLERRTALTIFDRLALQREQASGTEMEKGVPDLVYQLHRRFYPYAAMPGPAARFIVDVFDSAEQDRVEAVTQRRVLERFALRTGLPESLLRDDLPLSSQEISHALRSEVFGQDHAVELVSDVLATFKAGLNDPARPVAVLLFCGPTGVGKTQLARSLASYCFGSGEDEDRLVRLDMSEYAGFGAAARLVGDQAEGGSELVRRMRQQPFQVVLFDEIEKASREVFDVLLNLLDEGRLTDPYGRLTDFRSAIIIMTSNLGVQSRDPVGFGDAPSPHYSEEVLSFFRPEFGNRIDEIVIFSPLSDATMEEIARKELETIAVREGLHGRRVSLRWSDDLVHRLATDGFDRRYGARHLQRSIEERVVMPLARYLLDHEEVTDTTLSLGVGEGGRVSIEVE